MLDILDAHQTVGLQVLMADYAVYVLFSCVVDGGVQ